MNQLRVLGSLVLVFAGVGCDPGQHPVAPGAVPPAHVPSPAEQRLLSLMNAHRARGATCGRHGALPPAAPLSPSPALSAAALVHARDMIERGYLSHRDLAGQRAADRARREGYLGDVGENISWNAPEPEAALAAWMASPDHCANLMDARFRDSGVGSVDSSSFGLVWVATFGVPSRD